MKIGDHVRVSKRNGDFYYGTISYLHDVYSYVKVNERSTLVARNDEIEKITDIGINFGDNDFGMLFEHFFKSVLFRLDYNPTKEQVVLLFNELAYGIYLSFQNWPLSKFRTRPEICDKLYLRILVENVYFNDEIPKFLEDRRDYLNYAFFYSQNMEFKVA